MKGPLMSAVVSLVCVVLGFALLLAGCGGTATTSGSSLAPTGTSTATSGTGPGTSPPSSTSSTSSTTVSTSAPLSTLSPRQLAGQRVIFSYSGLTPPDELITLISRGEAAGVIFFGDNISSEAQIRDVIRSLDEANADPANPVRAPLLLMTDQEGGTIRRLPGAPELSAKQIGESADALTQASAAGRGAGENLLAAGMNVNLAPVLDVYREEGNFDDKDGRSFSTDPRVVSQLGAEFITAQQETGVAAAAKHFPGLGAAARSENTDLRPVTLSVGSGELETVDEYPYQAAIAGGVRLVMVSWAIYPELDAANPAGFSPTIVKGRLRDRLGFRGVIISDALGAKALDEFGSFGDRAVLAARAGVDLLICSATDVSDFSQGVQASEGLETALLEGALDGAAFLASAQRVVNLRLALGP